MIAVCHPGVLIANIKQMGCFTYQVLNFVEHNVDRYSNTACQQQINFGILFLNLLPHETRGKGEIKGRASHRVQPFQ